jgi:hypothetical protein
MEELIAGYTAFNNWEPTAWVLYAIDDNNGRLDWTSTTSVLGDAQPSLELINPGDTVKVFVKPEASPERVAMALREIADLIERQAKAKTRGRIRFTDSAKSS